MWRCVGLLSTIIAGCPLRAYKVEGKKEVFPDLLSPGNGNMRYTQFELWELVVSHIMLWGNAFVLKWRDPTIGFDGYRPIADLRPIDPSRVTVKVDKQTREKIFEVAQVDENGNPVPGKAPIILTTYEIMHIPGLGYNGLTGLSPVQNSIRTLGTAIAADKLAARFYSKGTLLSGIVNVKAPLSDQTQADSIRDRWIARSGGVAHGAEVAVLDAETTFQPLTIPPDALQFLESRRWQTTEIARMFGIPPHLVGDVEKTTSWGTGIEQQNIAFGSYTVSSYTNRIGQRASREVIPMSTQFCEFDLNRIMRGSMAERFSAYAVAITAGWLTRNEARLMENREPLKGLDVPLMPMNMSDGSEAPSPTAPASPSGGNPDAGPNAGDSVAGPGNSGMGSTGRAARNGKVPDYMEV
jgi:HK97 family phage portal protein